MTEDELNAIEARCNAATPGPWRIGTGNEGDGYFDECSVLCADSVWRHKLDRRRVIVSRGCYGGDDEAFIDQVRADMLHIAHSRTDIPALIAEIRRLRGERDAISELADAFGTMCGGCFGGSISYRAQDRISAARKKLADAKAALEGREGT